MGILNHILNEILLSENSVSVSDISSALQDHNAINVNYISQTKDIASGERIIYPIAYGISTAGNQVLRVYQPEGDTASRVPSWKLFRLDGIKEWQPTGEKFTTRDIPNLKLKHDDQMQTELDSAFGGHEANKTIDSTPVTKQEIEHPANVAQDHIAANIIEPHTVKTPNTIDNSNVNNNIPSGINPETPVAPSNEPVDREEISTQSTAVEPQDTEPVPPISNTPIYQNDEGDMEDETEENNDLKDEAEKFNTLMERINRIYKR